MKFQKHYSYEKVVRIIDWRWSATFSRWTALVIFPDNTEIWSFPENENEIPPKYKEQTRIWKEYYR